MYNGKRIAALIPARGGSKRLPRKNIKPLLGKPLIAWTIEEARRNRHIDKLLVSTDDKEIAEISRRYGAEVPFLRPPQLAADDSKTIDVIIHALNWLEEKRKEAYDLVLLLQATSPLRTSEDINRALRLLFSKNARAVVSVCKAAHPPFIINKLQKDGCMANFAEPKTSGRKKRELPGFYELNGAIYVGYRDHIMRQKGFLGKNTYAYVMPHERSVDINDNVDFKFAEAVLRHV